MEGDQKTSSTPELRLKLVMVFLAILAVTLAIVLLTQFRTTDSEASETIERRVNELAPLFDRRIADEIAGMEMALHAIADQTELAQAFVEGDREGLIKVANSTNRFLSRAHNVSHFYFLRPDGEVFLRMHALDRHGDIIDRYTFEGAVDRQYFFSGLELGVLGTFTLRTVYPWIYEGELIGYLELGMEISHVLSQIETILGGELNVIFSRDGEAPFVLKSDQGPSANTLLNNYQQIASGQSVQFQREDNRYVTSSVPLLNAAREKVGLLALTLDVSSLYQQTRVAQLSLLAMVLVFGAIATLIFWRTVSQVQGAIAKDHQRSRQSIEDSQQALLESETRYQSIVNGLSDGIVVADVTGTILDFNYAAELIFGINRSEAIGKNLKILMPESHAQDHDGYLRRYLETGVGNIMGKGRELVGLRDGNLFPLRLGLNDIETAGKRLFVGTITDQTKVKELEEKLSRSQKMEAMGQLSGGIAHDFNNILGIIVGQIDLILPELPEGELQDRLENVQNAAFRGAGLTRRILDFSRQGTETASALDVNKVINGMRGLMQKSLTNLIQLDLDLSADLKLVEIDPSAFEDVMINLIFNARDAMDGAGHIVIETCLVRLDADQIERISAFSQRDHAPSPGEFVEVAVSDNGRGIERDVVNKIFEPFFTTKEEGRGTGLGLSMVYGFVQRFSGLIYVYSEIGMGSVFKLYFQVAASQASGVVDEALDESMPHGTEHVLVVDDEVELAEIAAKTLHNLGYQVHVAHDGREALKLLRNNASIECLFTDVVMPGGIDGFQLADEATELRPDLKVLLTSGFTGRRNAMNLQAERWIRHVMPKPYRNSDLSRRIRRVIDSEASDS